MTIKAVFDQGKHNSKASSQGPTATTRKVGFFPRLSKKGTKEPLLSPDGTSAMVQTAPEVGADSTKLAPPFKKRKSMIDPGKDIEDEEITKSGNQIFRAALGITIGYISLGVLVFSVLEGWNILDTLYFVVVTLTTVGYGDQEDWVNQGAMLFCAFYCLVGILLIGTALGIIAAEVIEARDNALKKAQSEAIAAMAGGKPQQKARTRVKTVAEISNALNLQMFKYCAPVRNFYILTTNPLIRSLMPSIGVLLVVLAAGMVLAYCDDHSLTFIECFYFAVITSTTIGYGDISPTTDGGKGAGILYLLIGVTSVGNVLSTIAGAIIEAKQKAAMEKVLAKKITVNDFKKFDVDGDGRIERTEFCMKKLMLMGLLRAEDVMRVEEEFDIMDADGSGEITFADLEAHIHKRESLDATTDLAEHNS